MKKCAYLFPGQGAQYPGMGKEFAAAFESAKRVFEEADDILSEPLSKLIFEGPEAELTKTKSSQTAIFVVSAALLATLQGQLGWPAPAICAGLSLGEYTALFASGRLSFKETLLLVQRRANFMNDACEKVPGTMAAVLGAAGADVEAAVRHIPGVWVANYNCPGQIVISGTREGVAAAIEPLKAAGARKVIPLQVHGAFHSGLMQSAEDALAPFIAAAPIVQSAVELVMNVPGDFVNDVTAIRENLRKQVTHSVRWEQSIQAIDSRGVSFYLEIGCGKTLSGLNKKIAPKAPTYSLEVPTDLDLLAKGVPCNC